MIPIYQPYLPKGSLKRAHSALDSTWISSKGEYLDEAKDMLKDLVGSKYCILVNNGTSATHLLSIALNKRSYKENTIVPDGVYVAAWNAMIYDRSNCIVPVTTDLETWNFDIDQVNQFAKKYDANVLVVHNIGNIVDVTEIDALTVEDNCEGFLGSYGQMSGTLSLASSTSFFGNKSLTTGEGGAVFTDDEEMFEFLNSTKGQGQSHIRYLHDKLGYNYRMTNVQAAILIGQLELVDQIISMKEEIFEQYDRELDGVIIRPKIHPRTDPSNWMYAVRIPGISEDDRIKIEHYMYQNYIETRSMFFDIGSHEYLKDFIRYDDEYDSGPAKLLRNEVLMLPSYPELTKNKVSLICNSLKDAILRVKNK